MMLPVDSFSRLDAGRICWITWHDHARSKSIAARLGIPILLYGPHDGVRRHLGGSIWAIAKLAQSGPLLVFTHYSYLLQVCCALYKTARRDARVYLVADCHNKALKRDLRGPLGPLYRICKKWALGQADLIVVSNDLMVPVAKAYGDNVVALRDLLPEMASRLVERGGNTPGRIAEVQAGPGEGVNGRHVLFICSFDSDEPLDLIFTSARQIAETLDCTVVVTGDRSRIVVPREVEAEPRVVFPGYLPLEEYQAVVSTAAAVVVLTEDTDCLVCGGYEGIAAGRPTVLSDTPALRACFGGAAIYARHNAAELVDAVVSAVEGAGTEIARDSISFLQGEIEREWQRLMKSINEMTSGHE